MNQVANTQRGVLVLAGPAHLMQFIWYANTYGDCEEWDVVVIQYGGKSAADVIAKRCQITGLFKNISIAEAPLTQLNGSAKAALFLKMAAYYVMGKRKVFAHKYVNRFFDWTKYKTIVCECDDTILSGCLLLLANEKHTVVLEDGIADYLSKRRFPKLRDIFSINELAYSFLARMGYGDPSNRYFLKGLDLCERYATLPEKLPATDGNAKRLFEFTADYTPTEFKNDLSKIFQWNPSESFINADTIVFTTPFWERCSDAQLAEQVIIEQIKTYKPDSVLLKKHPRDHHDYSNWNCFHISQVPSDLPGELVLPFARGKKVIFMFASSLLLQAVQQQLEVYVVLPTKLLDAPDVDSARFLTNLLDVPLIEI